MTFVNEYVSDDDIKKYGLNELWLKYSPEYKGFPSSFRHEWTIDRDRNAYFKVMGGGGREENYKKCVLNINGTHLTVRIRVSVGSSLHFSDQPFKINWELIDIDREKPRADHDETIKVLKDALLAYGYAGARRQVPNTIVEFQF